MASAPEDRWVSIEGLGLHYRDWGGDGPPIVLVHGLASTCHIWDLVAPILAHSFSVVALDQRGHGESDKPDTGYDFETVAADLRGFIRAAGSERPVLVGHSWGGNVAVEYAVTYPNETVGLCLVDGGTIEISADPGMTLEQAREAMAPPDFTGLTLQQLREMGKSRDFGFEITPEVEKIMLANFEIDPRDDTVRARFPRKSHMAVIDAFWAHRPSELYQRVACPVLLMPTKSTASPAQEWDQARRDSIETAVRLLPNSKTVWLEDSIHDVPLQRPELVASVIEDHVRSGFLG